MMDELFGYTVLYGSVPSSINIRGQNQTYLLQKLLGRRC